MTSPHHPTPNTQPRVKRGRGAAQKKSNGSSLTTASEGLRTLGVLLRRSLLARRAGQTFGGKRDLYEVFGYRTTLTFDDYLAKYARQDIASRIVDAPADAIWQRPPEVVGTEEFTRRWDELVRGLRLWNKLNRVDKLAGLGSYAVLVLGYDDSSRLDIPVRAGRARNLLYVQPFSQSSVSIQSFVSDPRSPRFNLPEFYTIDLSAPSTTSIADGLQQTRKSTRTVKVHYSRVVHVAENLLEDDTYGIPRLAQVYNLLDDLLKVAGGSAEVFWLSGRQGLQADIDKDLELDAADAAALSDELEEYMHELRRFIRTRGVKLNSIGADAPSAEGPFNMIISLIASTTGIPKRILMGSEAGQLAAEQDRANWAERIEERRTNFAEPVVLHPLIKGLQQAGVLPESEFEIKWPPAFKLSPLEEGQMMAQKARAATNLSRMSLTGELLTREEARVLLGHPPEMPTDGTPIGERAPLADSARTRPPTQAPGRP